MGIHEALYARLKAVSGVTDLVGDRIYPDQAPEPPTAPFIVFEIDDDTAPAHAMSTDASLRRAFTRLYCFAVTGDAARALATAVIAALRRYAGTSASVVVDDCYLQGDRPADDDAVKLRGRLVTFEVCYQG